jgi:hypothetical protein
MVKKRIIIISLTIIGIFFVMKSCNHYLTFSKDKHQHTEDLGNHIFKEKFETFSGGVLMTNDYSYYVTDSLKFRKFVGECDEKELYKFAIIGDTIKAIKYSRRVYYGREIAIDSSFFSIKELRKEGDFE